jgi:hypothetical protein
MKIQDEVDPRAIDGLALMRAFLQISDPTDRRKVIELAAALAAPDRGAPLGSGSPPISPH